jgi:Ni,Fe-hydrogenase I large subunit
VYEYITSSRYNDDSSDPHPKHPSEGYTDPNFDKTGAYSWAKSPRYRISGTDYPMEVGALARMQVRGWRYPSGAGSGQKYYSYKSTDTKSNLYNHRRLLQPLVDAGIAGALPSSYTCGVSAMDRHRARALEAQKIAARFQRAPGGGAGTGWLDDMNSEVGNSGYDDSWTLVDGEGRGAHEAPRGALAHWVKIENGKIKNYQCVVPTTWNVNPSDGTNPGPIENAIMSPATPLSGKKSPTTAGGSATAVVPVEVLRVVQSFDPCIACTVHVIDGRKVRSRKEVTR